MENRIWGGRALIGVALLTVFIFLIHPVKIDDHFIGPFGVNALTHAIALTYVPAIAFGTFALAEWLGLHRPIVRLALAFNLLAVVLMTIAPLVSGWVAPVGAELGRDFAALALAFNQAMARGYIFFTAAAMVFNGMALERSRPGLRLFSWVASTLPLAWVASGLFAPNVHAMLILAILQGAWFLWIGLTMIGEARSDDKAA